MDRRSFIKSTSLAAIAAGVSPQLLRAARRHDLSDNLGLQLWTVRNQLAEDVSATMKSIADAGYAHVELMNTLNSEDVVAAAGENGLAIHSAFIDWQAICRVGEADAPSLDAILERAHQLNLDYLVFGYIGKNQRETSEQYQRHADTSNQFGEKCKEAGIQLCYHNHSFEFGPLEGSTSTGFDIFIERFDRELVQFELDVFWVAIGGQDPIEMIQQLGERIGQIHLKDWIAGGDVIHDEGRVPAEAFKEVGAGVLDFEAILSSAADIGVGLYHVEQDQSPDPLTSIRQSIEYLRDA